MTVNEYNLTSRKAITTKLSDTEVIATFYDEAKVIVPRLIKSFKRQRKVLEKYIAQELTNIRNASDDEFFHYYWTLLLMLTKGEELRDINKNLARLYRQQNIIDGKPKPKGTLPDGAIEAAREYPIEDIIDTQFRRSGSNLVGLCFATDEKTPSFYIYTKQNYACCFGACGFRGDSIEVYKQLHGVDFKTAVLALSGGRT